MYLSAPGIFVGCPAFLADGDDPLVGRYAQGKDLPDILLAANEEFHASIVHAMHRNLVKNRIEARSDYCLSHMTENTIVCLIPRSVLGDNEGSSGSRRASTVSSQVEGNLAHPLFLRRSTNRVGIVLACLCCMLATKQNQASTPRTPLY